MYLRKMSPSTTCLYSAASMEPRMALAAAQSWASKPRLAEVPFRIVALSLRRLAISLTSCYRVANIEPLAGIELGLAFTATRASEV